MSPATHILLSWLTANADGGASRRERNLVVTAGMIPDVDGLGIIPEFLTRSWDHPVYWYSEYHHILGHNIGMGLAVTALAVLLARRKLITGALACGAFHLHIVCDLAGSRGPGGEQWPIHYFVPFADNPAFLWDGAWELNSWPNLLTTVAALLLTGWLAIKRGYSPVDIFAPRADAKVVSALRERFGQPPPEAASSATDSGEQS